MRHMKDSKGREFVGNHGAISWRKELDYRNKLLSYRLPIGL